MSQYDKNRIYTEFPTHVDNALDKVQGSNINKIQNAVNTAQQDTAVLYNKTFQSDCLFVLQNKPDINYMFMLDMDTEDDILKSRSNNYLYDKETQSFTAAAGNLIGIIHSVAWKSAYDGSLNDFYFKVDTTEIPRGATIKYYISNDLANYFPIKPNDSVAKHFTSDWDKLYIKIEIKPNSKGESPRLFGVALYCKDNTITTNAIFDKMLDSNAGETNQIKLVYDAGHENRLCSVLQNGATTQIEYDENGDFKSSTTTTAIDITKISLVKDEEGNVISIIKDTKPQ